LASRQTLLAEGGEISGARQLPAGSAAPAHGEEHPGHSCDEIRAQTGMCSDGALSPGSCCA